MSNRKTKRILSELKELEKSYDLFSNNLLQIREKNFLGGGDTSRDISFLLLLNILCFRQ